MNEIGVGFRSCHILGDMHPEASEFAKMKEGHSKINTTSQATGQGV